jgi:hypothetical protein
MTGMSNPTLMVAAVVVDFVLMAALREAQNYAEEATMTTAHRALRHR